MIPAERAPLVVVGDLLLDADVHGTAGRLAPDAPVPVLDVAGETLRPGGAGLAAVLAAAAARREVVLIAPLAEDDRASRLVALLAERGVTTIGLALEGATPLKRRILAQDGRPLLRLDEGGGTPSGPLPLLARRELRDAAAVLVADYGQGATGVPEVRQALAAAAETVPVVWDPHPRGAPPVPGVALATPNLAELAALVPGGAAASSTVPDVAASAATLRRHWDAHALAVTLGERGALLVRADADGAHPAVVPLPEGRSTASGPGDTCGAGDCFAAAATLALADGADVGEAVGTAVPAAARFVRAGGAAAVRDSVPGTREAPAASVDGPLLGLEAAVDLAEQTRSRGGTVVATGGCFDLLHAGHVATLRAARELGDCLVVLMNSDVSVRRLKGPSRPVVPQHDRAHVLAALDCVDAVVVFDDDTPVPSLRALRPAVWAKGGDYAGTVLPEAAEVDSWGGTTVVLPYLEGRSTTGIVRRVAAASATAAG